MAGPVLADAGDLLAAQFDQDDRSVVAYDRAFGELEVIEAEARETDKALRGILKQLGVSA